MMASAGSAPTVKPSSPQSFYSPFMRTQILLYICSVSITVAAGSRAFALDGNTPLKDGGSLGHSLRCIHVVSVALL